MRHLVLPPILGALLLTGLAAHASAQVTLLGTVHENESEIPLAGVQVEILDPYSRRLAVRYTDEHGRFQARVRTEQAYRLRASRIGYVRTTTPLLWTDGYAQIHVDIRLDADAVVLAPLEVVARARARPSPVLEGFRQRQLSGVGHFINRVDVERRNPSLVTDLIAAVPGVRLESSGRGLRRIAYMSRGTRSCPAQIWVDGMLLNPRTASADALLTIDDAVAPGSVEAIEIYSGLSTVPAEFLTPEASCGVIAIWTRRGDPRPAPAATNPPDPARDPPS
jgi:hypothetical protein